VVFFIFKETIARDWGMTFLWTSRMQGMKPMYIPILPQFAISPENKHDIGIPFWRRIILVDNRAKGWVWLIIGKFLANLL
jgi:hypothetical protein